MRLSARLTAFILAASFASASLIAQSILLPKSITFTGTPIYTQDELLAYSGIKPGAISTQQALQDAAQRLSDTGLFSDIHFESNAKGLVFALKLMPQDNLLPVRYKNFVWWTPKELDSLVRTRVPLYQGNVPISGNLQEKVAEALKSLVTEKGVPSVTIATLPSASQPGATPTALAYAIDGPQVVIHSLTIAQASPAMLAKLDKVIKSELGKPFEQDITRTDISNRVAGVYRNDGFLDIAVTDVSFPAPTITATSIDLDLTATLREGEPYRLSALTWPGSTILSTADFQKAIKLHPGDIASEAALRQSLGVLSRAYFSKGYQDAKIQASATMDTPTHQVAYTIRAVPGDEYHVKAIHTLGLSEQQHKAFDSGWKMKPGDVYDTTYLANYLIQNTSSGPLRGYTATWRAVSDPESHLVDLTITFYPVSSTPPGN